MIVSIKCLFETQGPFPVWQKDGWLRIGPHFTLAPSTVDALRHIDDAGRWGAEASGTDQETTYLIYREDGDIRVSLLTNETNAVFRLSDLIDAADILVWMPE